MSKNLKRVLVTGAALLMFASVGAGTNNINVNARRVRSHRVAKVNRKPIKRVNKNQNTSKAKHQVVNRKNGKNKPTVNSKKVNKRKNVKRHAKKQVRNHKRINRKNNKRKVNKRSRKFNVRRNRKQNRRNRFNKKRANRLAKKVNQKKRRNKRAKKSRKGFKILRSNYRRSNSKKLLNRSGFVNLNQYESNTPEIMNYYAPNDRRAVVPKRLNPQKYTWLQGDFKHLNPNLLNPTAYQYVSARHGWMKMGTL